MKALAKFEIAACNRVFRAHLRVWTCPAGGPLAKGVPQDTADLVTGCAVLGLFFVFALSLIGLAFHFFVSLQVRAGERFRASQSAFYLAHETGLKRFAFWGIVGMLGKILVALPVVS